jgi:hypothetical protein
MTLPLNAEEAQIFRITHISNVPWILRHGLHCRSSGVVDPDFTRIGNASLIDKRQHFPVPIAPRGVLSDYVPFYFTPRSIMLFNIVTGHKDTPIVPRSEIVTIVARFRNIRESGISAIFTDQHAVSRTAQYFHALEHLNNIDWAILRNSDFKLDPDDPGKTLRYHAEALVHGFLPCEQIAGIGCRSENEKRTLEGFGRAAGMELNIVVRPDWFF